jgi:hypothetical protein
MVGGLGAEGFRNEERWSPELRAMWSALICVKLRTHTAHNMCFIRYVWLYVRVFQTTDARMRRRGWLVIIHIRTRGRMRMLTHVGAAHHFLQGVKLRFNMYKTVFLPLGLFSACLTSPKLDWEGAAARVPYPNARSFTDCGKLVKRKTLQAWRQREPDAPLFTPTSQILKDDPWYSRDRANRWDARSSWASVKQGSRFVILIYFCGP